MRVVTPLDLRRSLGAILDAASAGERLVIERNGRPLAMLVSVEEGRRLDPDAEALRLRRIAALDRIDERTHLTLMAGSIPKRSFYSWKNSRFTPNALVCT